MCEPDLKTMGSPILDRDRPPARVLQKGQMDLIGPTYQRTPGRHGSPATRRRASASSWFRALAATLACFGLAAGAARASTLVIEGAGNGHGVGMSQDGALGFAQHGFSYAQILSHYYSGTTIGVVPAQTVVRVLVGGKVRRVGLERYVRGVIAAEMSSSWPLAALEAQAVASRTYALTAHAGGTRFDVYSDTRSQVYRGVAAETSATNAAVTATAGQILLYAGKPAITYFFADSGGMTDNVENAWPGAEAEPWLLGVTDPYDAGPSSKWKLGLSFRAAGHMLAGLYRGSFRGIEVLKRGVSPRIVSARVTGSRGGTVIDGPQLAGRLGLGSTWAYFSVRNGTVLTPEPDHSGQSRDHSTAPAGSTVPGQGGGVSPVPNQSPATLSSSGGTPPA
jgi:SpoIID/LytB domain protein